jgi:hypothetical protein
VRVGWRSEKIERNREKGVLCCVAWRIEIEIRGR